MSKQIRVYAHMWMEQEMANIKMANTTMWRASFHTRARTGEPTQKNKSNSKNKTIMNKKQQALIKAGLERMAHEPHTKRDKFFQDLAKSAAFGESDGKKDDGATILQHYMDTVERETAEVADVENEPSTPTEPARGEHAESNKEIFTRVLHKALNETLDGPTGAVVLTVRSIVETMVIEYFCTWRTKETFLNEGWLNLCEVIEYLLDRNKHFPGAAKRSDITKLVGMVISKVKQMDEYETEIVPRQKRDRLRHIDRYIDIFTREREMLLKDKEQHPNDY